VVLILKLARSGQLPVEFGRRPQSSRAEAGGGFIGEKLGKVPCQQLTL
jgi:hypothetical protein